jgi:hypothetical protein
VPESMLPPAEVCEELRSYAALNRISRPVEPVKLTLLLGKLRADGYSVAVLADVCELGITAIYGRLRNYKRYRNGEDLPGFPSHWRGECDCHA